MTTTLRIKELNATNALCFESLYINFEKDKVTQLIGDNGVGKSSIPTLLEEVLYNKNSRGLAKSEIKNRYLDVNYYIISCLFVKGNDEYRVVKTVKSSAKVELTKNGEDISGHTATQTYKQIQEIIGLDFATFTKLIYQSMESSLDFLKATDANRKKFFMGLFNLSEYIETEEKLKAAYSEAQKEYSSAKTKVDTIKSWIEKNSSIGSRVDEIKPDDNTDLADKIRDDIAKLNNDISTVDENNAASKRELEKRSHLERLQKLQVAPCTDNSDQLQRVTRDHERAQKANIEANTKLRMAKAEADKASNYEEKCSKCGQDLDFEQAALIYDEAKEALAIVEKLAVETNSKLTQITHALNEEKKEQKAYQEYQKHERSVELAKAAIDPNMDVTIENIDNLKTDLKIAQVRLADEQKRVADQQHAYMKACTHNAALDEKERQLSEYKSELEIVNSKLTQITEIESDLKILKESFSGKGLINFKIESIIKAFEDEINNNLIKLTDGQFSMNFIVEDAKLKLKMYSHSEEVSIKSLSTGEFNKVNMSSLLAVRTMMAKMSDVSLNVLFLDEVISVLSATSLETLIDHLLSEDLNTFIVSHEYSHPLAEEIHIVKTNNISEIK